MKIILFSLLITLPFFSNAQLEDFEAETTGATSFTNNGQIFDITNGPGESTYDVEFFGSGGWNGTGVDDKFIDNSSGGPAIGDGTSFTITTTDGTDIYLNSFYLFVSNRNLTASGQPTTLTFTGRKEGVVQFTVVKTTGIVNGSSFTPNNGFTFIDFTTEGGSDNSNTAIDEINISATNNADYLALDAMNWEFAPAAPEIDIEGNAASIADGDITPSLADDTDFGSVVISANATNTFTIQNEGASTLTLSGGPNFVSVTGDPGFTVVSQPAGSIAAGGSTTFQIRFTAACGQPVSQDAIVSVSSDDADESPYTFTVDADITGVDTDSDGIFNDCDPDDDNDGIADASDPDDADFNVCGDSDGDGCDDCSVTNDGYGALSDSDPANDGTDSDCDGICDATDVTDDSQMLRGNMLQFSGADFLSIGDVPQLNFGKNSSFTIEAWIQTSAGGDIDIISKYGGIFSNGWVFQHSSTNNSLAVYMQGGLLDGIFAGPTGAPLVADGLWHHVAVSYDGSNAATGFTFYVDGVAYMGTALGGLTGPILGTVTNAHSATIGAYEAGGPAEFWVGDMDEVRVWNSVRTIGDIRLNRHLTLSGGCDAGIVGYWKFNETSGTVASDVSGNGNVGVFVGTPIITSSQASVGNGVSTSHNAIATNVGYNSLSMFAGHSLLLSFGTAAPGGEIVVSYIAELPVGGVPSGALTEFRYDHWIVDNYGPTNAGLGATGRFNYQDGGITSVSLASYRMHKRGSNAIGAWAQNNAFATASSTVGGNNYIEFNSINDFSMLFPSSGISPLPVELMNFQVSLNDTDALLEWSTASEHNNVGFRVEYSRDLIGWESIGFVEGAIDSYSNLDYQFIHRNLSQGLHYYRLVQLDVDDTETLTDFESVYVDWMEDDFLIVPNPAKDLITLVLNEELESIVVSDMSGRAISLPTDIPGKKVDLSHVSPGYYTLFAKTKSGKVKNQSFIVVR